MTCKKLSSQVVKLEAGEKVKLLIISDVHFDSLQCDRESLKKHLEQAKESGAKVLCIGDWFDVMGCWFDPRSKSNDIDPRYIVQGRTYLDLVVEDSYEFLKPYAGNLLFLSEGNHEYEIKRRRDVDILERLTFMLSQHDPVHKLDYAGYLITALSRRPGNKGMGCTRQHITKFHHGTGGGAIRSKDVLKSQIDTMKYPDADLIVSGHSHNKIHDPSNVVEKISPMGKVYHSAKYWLKLGTYKKSATGNGYEVMRGLMPSKMGGWWVDLDYVRVQKTDPVGQKKEIIYIDTTITEAKPVVYHQDND